MSRREWLSDSLQAAVVAPALWLPEGGGYRLQEIEDRLRKGKDLGSITREDIPTPSLVVDLDALEGNLEKMNRHARQASINLRPHAKTHKCVEIARRQIKGGAIGISVANIHEAEVLAAHGIPGLLITSELVGREKMARLLRLARKHPDVMAVVDHPDHARQLSEAAQSAQIDLKVLVDIDPIGRRTGVPPGPDAVALAELVDQLPRLQIRGIHCYSGISSHVTGFEERRRHSFEVMEKPLQIYSQLKKKGLPLEIMSGASTGTYNIDSELEGMTEMQVGSYVFMDIDYQKIGGRDGDVYRDFSPALTVLTTVISKNHPDRATVDAGIKAFATDREFGPEPKDLFGVSYRIGGDEHGILVLENPSREVRLGDRLELVVPHCDPNVNLYDRLFCFRKDRLEAVWAVDARGHGRL